MKSAKSMSQTDPFNRALDFVLQAGAPCVDNLERAHRGETYKGINRAMNPEWPGWIVVDRLGGGFRPGPCLESSRALTGLVRAHYRVHYWESVFSDTMPEALALVLFDSAVMHGRNRALSFLQEALNTMFGFPRLEVDGIFRRNSREALAAMLDRHAWHRRTLVAELLCAREKYCEQIPCADRSLDRRCRSRMHRLQMLAGVCRDIAGWTPCGIEAERVAFPGAADRLPGGRVCGREPGAQLPEESSRRD